MKIRFFLNARTGLTVLVAGLLTSTLGYSGMRFRAEMDTFFFPLPLPLDQVRRYLPSELDLDSSRINADSTYPIYFEFRQVQSTALVLPLIPSPNFFPRFQESKLTIPSVVMKDDPSVHVHFALSLMIDRVIPALSGAVSGQDGIPVKFSLGNGEEPDRRVLSVYERGERIAQIRFTDPSASENSAGRDASQETSLMNHFTVATGFFEADRVVYRDIRRPGRLAGASFRYELNSGRDSLVPLDSVHVSLSAKTRGPDLEMDVPGLNASAMGAFRIHHSPVIEGLPGFN